MIRRYTIAAVVLAAGILAAGISVAQARPMPAGYAGQSSTQSTSEAYHPPLSGAAIMTLYYHPAKPQLGPRTRSIDRGNAQHVPAALTKTRLVPASSTGLDWTATTLLGAAITGLVLLAALTGSRIRSRRVAQL